MVTKVTMNKHRSTWHYTAHNSQGGSFGSNHCGSKKVALHMATRGVKHWSPFELVTNGKSEGVFTVNDDGKVVKAVNDNPSYATIVGWADAAGGKA